MPAKPIPSNATGAKPAPEAEPAPETAGTAESAGAQGDELLGFFRAMADPSRLKIVGLLAQQAYAVEQLSALLGLGESTVSHHLSRLADAGLVSARPDGHYSMYSLHQEALTDS